jgi:hypothetical protein
VSEVTRRERREKLARALARGVVAARDDDSVTREDVERHLVETLLGKIEHATHGILSALGCPTNDVLLGRDLAADAPFPGLSADDLDRVRYAHYVLVHVDMVRDWMETQPVRAIEAALLAGLYAGDAVRNVLRSGQLDAVVAELTVVKELPKKGGRMRGKKISKDAETRGAKIVKFFRQYQNSEAAQDEFPSATAYIQQKTRFQPRTIQRHLSKLGLT